MRTLKTRRPSPALVISIIALFVAMAGGAYAAKAAKNSVGASALKKNAVTAVKIQKNAVTSDKIATGAITEGKLANPASSIRAWGRVAPAGTLSAGQNMTVAPNGTGRYCISTGFAPSSAVATFDAAEANLGNTKPILVQTNSGLCPGAPNNVRVSIANDAGADANRGFYIQIN